MNPTSQRSLRTQWQQLHIVPMLTLMRGQWRFFSITVCLSLLQLAMGIAIAALGAWLVGLVGTGADVKAIIPPFRLLLGLVLAGALVAWCDMWLAHDLAYRVLAVIRNALFDRLKTMSPGMLEQQRTGDIVSAAMADVETLEWFYAHTLGAFFACTLVPTAALMVLWYLYPTAALILLPFLLAQLIVPVYLAQSSAKQGRAVRRQLGGINATVMDLVQGLREVVCFGAERHLKSKLQHLNQTYLKAQMRYGKRAGMEQAASLLFSAIGMLTVLILCAIAVNRGTLQPQLFPALVILAGAVFGPVTALAGMLSQMGLISAAAGRVFKLLHSQDRLDESSADPTLKLDRLDIEFDNVHFTYQETRKPALEGMSFQISQGEAVALAGPSGAGKSTCAKLLLRFFDPQSGQIRLGGHCLKHIPLEELRRLVAWVPQDIYLFNQSIADNIALGQPDAAPHDIVNAAKQAAAHDFIEALPNGYQTLVGERGMQLSGGQRQRIAIARAFLKNAPIVVLDEAASNLDNENELALQKAMANLRSNRTTITIAHRLTTLLAADRILVIEDGALVETGSPEQLLNANSSFATLVAGQRETHPERSFSCQPIL